MTARQSFNRPAVLILTIFGCLTLTLSSLAARAAPLAYLESPSPHAFFRSGVGLIRGWSCEAGRVEVSVDGGPLQATASGTNRPDTATVCGRTDTGFGLIYNWNRIGEGLHNLRALVNGCLLYTSPSPRDGLLSRMPSSA